VNLGPNVSFCPGGSATLNAGNPGLTYLWSTGATTQTITVSTGGIYFVRVSNAECSTSDTILVSINAAPVVNLGNDLNICTSDTVTLDAGNAGATYLWSTGATTRTIRVSDAGTYSVVVTNPTTGCTATDAVVVTNKAVPVSTFSTVSANGQSVTFLATSTTGLQFLWNFGDPTSSANTSQLASPTHVFTTPGTYTVTLTVTSVATGCKSTTKETIVVTGLGNDFAEAFKLGAAPNPFVGQTLITYVLPENANNVSVEVYDMIGRKVGSILTNEYQSAGKYEYDFKNEDLQTSSGVYMVRLTVDGKVGYIRIVDIAKK
jgi:PKD repeat protein